MIKLPFFGKTKLLLALEYGFIISNAAKEMKVEVTPELMKRAEEIILNEFQTKTSERLAIDMTPNIMAVFEPVDTV